jgi:hypothetical protein
MQTITQMNIYLCFKDISQLLCLQISSLFTHVIFRLRQSAVDDEILRNWMVRKLEGTLILHQLLIVKVKNNPNYS